MLGVWQFLVLDRAGSREYAFPSPGQAFEALFDNFDNAQLCGGNHAAAAPCRASLIALVIGGVVGALVARIPVLRAAVGSMITGLQTMPSVAWFPLAILLFKLTEGAILFVVVLGAAPSIANGLINGIDNIPPVLLRAGRVLGASGCARSATSSCPRRCRRSSAG